MSKGTSYRTPTPGGAQMDLALHCAARGLSGLAATVQAIAQQHEASIARAELSLAISHLDGALAAARRLEAELEAGHASSA